MRHVIQAS